MKRIYFNSPNRFSRFVTPVVITFLLQSCWLLCPRGNYVTKTPCNCKDDKKAAYAVFKDKQRQADEEMKQPGAQPVLTRGLEELRPKNLQASVMMDADDLSVNSSADPINETYHASQTHQYISETNTKEPEEETKLIETVNHDVINIQQASVKKLPLGIKAVSTSIIAAPNMSFKSSKENYGNIDHKHKPGVGFVAGIGSSFKFTDKFAVSTAILFKQNKASEILKYSVPGEPGSYPNRDDLKSDYSYSYLSVPVLAEIKLSDRLTATAGPEINYLLDASVKTNDNGDKDKTKITDNSVKVGAGIQLGMRYDFPGSPLAVQLIYDHRLSRLNKKTESYYVPGGGGNSDSPAWNLKSVQLGLTCSICDLLKKN